MQDSKPYHFKPNDVANMTGASIQTVRRWTDLFADLLSESANPAPGNPRLYSWADVEVIKQIKALRDQNVPVEAIAERLSSPTSSPATVTQELAPQSAQESPQQAPGIIQALSSQQAQIDALQRTMQDARRFDAVGLVGLGIVIGLVFATMFIALASLYGAP